MELKRYLIKKKIQFVPISNDEELYYEEVVSSKKEMIGSFGKLFLTNKGIRFEGRETWFENKFEWQGLFQDIESIKESKYLNNLELKFSTQGKIEITTDNRKKLKERILRRMN